MPWQGEFRHAQTTSALEAVLQRHIDSLGDPPGFNWNSPGFASAGSHAPAMGPAGVFTDWRVCLPMRTLGVNDFGYSLRVECKSYEMAVY